MDFALLEMDYMKSGLSRGHARSLNHNRQPLVQLYSQLNSLHFNYWVPSVDAWTGTQWMTQDHFLTFLRIHVTSNVSFDFMLRPMSLSTSLPSASSITLQILSTNWVPILPTSLGQSIGHELPNYLSRTVIHHIMPSYHFPGICVEIERVIISEVSRLEEM